MGILKMKLKLIDIILGIIAIVGLVLMFLNKADFGFGLIMSVVLIESIIGLSGSCKKLIK